VATIGVYGFDAETFLACLREAGVTLLIDVRQRRGVRGADYAWANAKRLEAALTDAGIDYLHRKDLAPTTEMRKIQYAEDDRHGVGKRSRQTIGAEFARRYSAEVLDAADLASLIAAMTTTGLAALLCVETEAAACHRSLITDRLGAEHDLSISHLRP